jgi:hypothetical protein
LEIMAKEKAVNGGLMAGMTRKRYLKGGQV